MAFPPDILDRIRAHYPMSALIGRYMPLKRAGREHSGLCPFHGEKTPSFTVNDQKQFFHCFGCGAHGDAIEFIKRYERLTYPEAVEKLAREANIALPVLTREAAEVIQRRGTLLEAMEAACRYFQGNLAASDAMVARNYVQSRGITPATQARFRIGLASLARDGLKQQLLKQGFEEAKLVEAGLLIRPEGGGVTYDRFRARLMIPIRNHAGKVIAFGGRLMDANAHGPKYLNSPETPLFKKGEVLFNLDQADAPARKSGQIAVVEGYMDVILMAQAGVEAAVATLGTAVTEAHLQTLWRYASAPTLCLDGDAAGQRAALRAAELALPLLKPGYDVRVALLPKGEDPDSLVRSRGREALEAVLTHASLLHEVLWRHHSAATGPTPMERAALKHTLTLLAGRITNPDVQKEYREYFYRQLRPEQPVKGSYAAAPMRSAEIEHIARTGSSIKAHRMRPLLKLLLVQPALLHQAEVEEYIIRLECGHAALNGLRDALVEAAAQADLLENTPALYAFLQEKGFSSLMTELLKDKTLPVPPGAEASVAAAKHAWKAACAAQARSALEEEYNIIKQSIDQNPLDEETYARLLQLQEQVKALNAAHAFSARQDDEAY